MSETMIPTHADRRRTPGLLLGPYYPLDPPSNAGAELWRGAVPAGARSLELEGWVRACDGSPLPHVRIEIWQADPGGRYRHPSAVQLPAPFEGFAGYGVALSDAAGRFVFRSLVPGAYCEGSTLRAPHLHLQVTGRFERLVTQLFLPDDARNGDDRWYCTLRHPHLLVPTRVRDDADGLSLRWTAFLTRG
jgi:protocatechuate 3,4-dioxygenase beta subunit